MSRYDPLYFGFDDDEHEGFPTCGDIFIDQHERAMANWANVPPEWFDPWVTPDKWRLAQLRSMPYAEYLETTEWRARRFHVCRDRGYSCQRCGAYRSLERHKLHVHHLTYERRGCELPEDLELLCEGCHQAEHGIAA